MSTIPDCQRLHRIGIAWMAVAAVTFPVKDSFLKAQDPTVPALLAISIYFFMQMILGVVGLNVIGSDARRNPFRGMTALHLLRSLTLTCALGTFFFSLRYVPLATAVTLYTLQGLFCIGFGRLLLHERIHARHLGLVAIATIGVVLVVRPESAGAGFGINLLPLFSGACGGLYIILTRKLGRMESSFQLVAQDGAVAGVTCMLLFLLNLGFVGVSMPPVPSDLLTILGPPMIAAVIGMISSLAMIKAAQLAPAAKLAPASYLEIASGALIGIFVFGEFLDWLTLSGIVIIVGVCLANSLLNEIETKTPTTG